MTISANVRKELFEMTANEGKLIRIKPTEAKAGTTVYSSKQAQPLKMWTQEEHEKFLEAMEKYPAGPWKVIAAFIGTKTTRQTMTHAQKYRQKIGRWRRGLRHKGRKQVAGPPGGLPGGPDAPNSQLFRAIEYVSSDEVGSVDGGDAPSPARSVAGSVNSMEGSELFRLAELASIEGMKQEPPSPPYRPPYQHFHPAYEAPTVVVVPSSPADVEMADVSRVQIKQEQEQDGLRLKLKQEQQQQQFGDWRGRLSPPRGEARVLRAVSGLSFLNAQHPLPLPASCGFQLPRAGGGQPSSFAPGGVSAFRLPPLNIAAQGSAAFAIPPLRSKIDPSVLSGRPHVAPSH